MLWKGCLQTTHLPVRSTQFWIKTYRLYDSVAVVVVYGPALFALARIYNWNLA
jgi:hypothetical protein